MFFSNPSIIAALAFAPAVFAACRPSRLVDTAEKWNRLVATGNRSEWADLKPYFTYRENYEDVPIAEGLATQGLPVSAKRTFFDNTACKFTTEHIVANHSHPYIITTQASMSHNATVLHELDVIVTDDGDFYDWNVTAYQGNVTSQDWGLVPETQRVSRQVLQDVADAYLDHLHDRTQFPAAKPCTVLSGGWINPKYANDSSADLCTHAPINESLPLQTITHRRYVIDESHGFVNIFNKFHGLERTDLNVTMPDSHMFRIEEGRLRHVHISAVCISRNCGW
ncbi:hypothetical protein M011DRAFT_422413 [Sporormia fimetaria CBS 119925]|uniref:DUF8021 domain-containing protein n=1 Tax=Sporormia fimetaria CBS 119925 TaxID=1340428 RepID=A0A6A6VG53_9PLEO|nr:hypothetical protein M011DRAFT_422413 [Sporormia fimetaria CBS 119925]